MIDAIHSCGDCGFVGRYDEYKHHLDREWHRLVMLVGLHSALDYHVASVMPDARRAVSMFRGAA